jgi:aspartyl-tRNA(Asn)/glutamyl-tRNA(Gln) amidotransferase subunit C
MASQLSRDDVRKIAALAHLALTDAEVDLFAAQLASILDYAAQVRELDTTDVTSSVTAQAPAVSDRDDAVEPSLPPQEALANAPDRAADTLLFRVPRVIG